MSCQIVSATDRLSVGPFVSVDTETTGIDTAQARVLELGLAVFEQGRCVSTRARLFDPKVEIPLEASRVHGIYASAAAAEAALRAEPGRLPRPRHVEGRPLFSSYRGLAPLMGSTRLVGFNWVGYDGPVLEAECARAGAAAPAPRGVDALIFVRWHLRGRRHRKLDEVAVHLGVYLEEAHTAGADAQAAGEVLLQLVQRGHCPDERDEALRRQAAMLAWQTKEWEKWSYHLYVCRKDRKTLRLGYGRHCGRVLEEVPEYLQWALEKHDEAAARHAQGLPLGEKQRLLPPAVVTEFRRCAARPARRPQLSMALPAGPAQGLHGGGT